MLIFTFSQFQQRLSSYFNVKSQSFQFYPCWQTNILSLVQQAIMFLYICFSGTYTSSSDTDSHLTSGLQYWKKLSKTLFNCFLYNFSPGHIYFILATAYQSFIVYDSIPVIHFRGILILSKDSCSAVTVPCPTESVFPSFISTAKFKKKKKPNYFNLQQQILLSQYLSPHSLDTVKLSQTMKCNCGMKLASTHV